jgi:asparagine synthase (glutamine-hydrolysing)
MCGICGFVGTRADRALHAMVGAMRHRGPDDSGTWAGESASLGMTRLAVLDLSAAGHQPMATDDAAIRIVYNGEVYNFAEQRRVLEASGVRFRSTSDTEVVLRLYERFGDDFVTRLRGMFALALWDARRGPGHERFVLARDHMGIKPVLYAEAGGRLVFASELKALLASGLVAAHIDATALRTLLTYGSVLQPRTMIDSVKALLPGHRLVVERGAMRVERYWALDTDRRPGLRARPYAEHVEAVAESLEESARLQLVSDVPIGAFLSGGVDSSILVAIMTKALGTPVRTFSVGFAGAADDIDESGDAERMARHLGTQHTTSVVRGDDVRDRITTIARALDQPSVDGVNSYFVSLAARRDVTVAVSGTGGDELFAGYPWFITMAQETERLAREPWRGLARSMVAAAARHQAFDGLLRRRGGGRIHRWRRGSFIGAYGETYQIFGPVGAARLLTPGVAAAAGAGAPPHRDLAPLDELARGSAIERVTALATRGYLTNQLLRDIDAVSMAHSLEVRVPYLDPVVVDTALSLPDSAKLGDVHGADPYGRTYRDSGAKRVLIDVGRRWLPPNFDVQPKRGFAMPFDAWLRGPLRDVMDDALDPRAVSSRGLLDSDVVSTIANRFRRGDTGWSEPWLLMMLELWCREVLDAPAHTVGDACLPPNATSVEPLRDVATAAIADGAR